MTVITFGEWAPDRAPIDNPGVITAKNVYPSSSGFRPVKSLQAATDALTARPRGAIQVTDKDLNVIQFAGDETKLYENASNSWGDKSIGGGYSTGTEEVWEFAAWENKILATNFSDNPQQLTFGAANFSNLTTTLKARHITVIRDFVVFANTFDATDGNKPNRIRWSAFGDETDYIVSASTLSDFQDLKTSQPIERVFGGEYGVIFQKNNIWRMSFVGAPVVFQFDQTIPGIGLMTPGAAVQDGDSIYFLSDRGFYSVLNGTQASAIGSEMVDRFVLDDIDQNNLHRVSSAIDPTTQRVYWAYPGSGNIGGTPNKIVVYDRSINRWSLIEQNVELLWSAGGVATTLEDLDAISSSLDDLGASLDSNRWSGGAAILGAFDTTFKSGSFDGSNMDATIITREFQFNDNARTMLTSFTPIIDGGTVTAKVHTRDKQSDAVTTGSTLNQTSTGRFTTRNNARFHRMEFNLSGTWKHAVGMEVDAKSAKRTGGRG